MDSDDSKKLMFYYILRFNACIVNQNNFLLEKCHCVQNVDPTYVQTIISRMLVAFKLCPNTTSCSQPIMLYSFAKGNLHAKRGQANLVWDGYEFQAKVDAEMGCKKAKGLLFSTRFSVLVTILI